MKRSLLIIFVVLVIDQVSKIWIKTHLFLGQEFHVLGNWFLIHFTENNGMAFGLEFGGSLGKFLLSIFRIILVIGIGWYLWRLIKTKAHVGLIVCFSLIFAGAIGNIIDSVFYGLVFSNSGEGLATAFSPEGGYSGLFHGKVVDMLYFPLIEGRFPDWLPMWGGEYFLFFRQVFNIADSAISIGVVSLLLFQRKFYKHNPPAQDSTEESSAVPNEEQRIENSSPMATDV